MIAMEDDACRCIRCGAAVIGVPSYDRKHLCPDCRAAIRERNKAVFDSFIRSMQRWCVELRLNIARIDELLGDRD